MLYRRILQQQPPRDRVAARQQQMSASSGFQAQPGLSPAASDKSSQMGAGRHERTRDDQKRVEDGRSPLWR